MKPPATVYSKWLIFGLVAVGVFMSTLDSSIVNIALPVIMADFQESLGTIEWVMVIYLLIISSLLLSFGRLSDIKGRRWVYFRGFLIFTIGSLLCSVSRNSFQLIAARAFQGIGAAMLMACSPAIVVDVFPIAERGKALGLVGTIVAAGLTAGPALGGVILNFFSWRAIFYINIPIGLIAAAGALRLLKGGATDVTRVEPFDWRGAFFQITALVTLLLTMTHLHQWGLASSLSSSLLLVAVLATVGFVLLERSTAYPIFEPSLLKNRTFAMSVLSAVILFASLFTITFLTPFLLIYPMGLSPDKAGAVMVIPFLFLFFISPVSGTLSDRFGSWMLCAAGMTILSVALFFFSQLPGSVSPPQVIWRMALAGIGIALFLPPNSSAAMGAVEPQHRGIASGTVATARNLGMVLGVAMAAAVFNYYFEKLSGGLSLKTYQPQMAPYFSISFRKAMLGGALLTVIGVVATVMRSTAPWRGRFR